MSYAILGMMGADAASSGVGNYNGDKKVVTNVQEAIVALPFAATDPVLKALADSLYKDSSGYGHYGPLTKAAVKKFNDVYGGQTSDGANITDATLAGLGITASGAPATQAVADKAQAVAAVVPTTASPAQVQIAAAAAGKSAAAVQATAVTSDAPPAAKAEVVQATQDIANAKTAADLKAATDRLAEVAKKIDEGGGNFLTREYAGIPGWTWGVMGAGALTVLGVILKLAFGRKGAA